MKINKNLLKQASFNPTKKTTQMSILDICESIDRGAMLLPLYQRDLSWIIDKAVDLFNYQLLGAAPVSPISTNVIRNLDKAVPQIQIITREIVNLQENNIYSIIDGQQRVTTNYKAYINHDSFRNIVLDVARGMFKKIDGAVENYQIPVGILLNKDTEIFRQYCAKNSTLKKDDCYMLLTEVRNKLRNYFYTINMAEDLDEDQQIDWFIVLNNAGSRVSDVQMKLSKLKIDGIDIYADYTIPFRNLLESSGLDLFRMKDTETSIPIATLNSAYEVLMERSHILNFTPIASDVRPLQICSMTPPNKIKQALSITLMALQKSIDYLQANDIKIDRIDYITYLTGFFVWLEDKELSHEQDEQLKTWLLSTSFDNKSNTERRKLFNNLLRIIGKESCE